MAGTLEPSHPGKFEGMKAWPQIVRDYISGLQLEMKRVTWPTRQQVQATTAVVILTVFAFAAYFKLVDELIANTVTKMYTTLAK
ncbi:MAG: preprotein translocase subunit SecE [Acidobacteriota bacterium]|nr:preprotein translocase subunit SecE [Acidobacteriota bacterium]